jgi:hyperosmotically inducible protein
MKSTTKMRGVVMFSTTLLIGGALLTSPVMVKADTSADRSDKAAAKEAVSDSWVTGKTKIALFADSRVKGREINVETKNGQVFLRGKVDTAEAKTAAEETAKLIDGVKSVKNELQIVAPSKREVIDEKDDVITKRVKQHLAKDARLKDADIAVKTNAGVVSLTGEVLDLTTSAKASWTAWKVSGVKSVKNDLSIKDKK